MPMFKKNLKLIATAVGLVAVLVMGLAVPGVTQQNPLSRASVVNAISNAVAATLTAAEGDVFDIDNAKFYSDTFAAFAYIPLHPVSRSYQLFDPQELLAGKTVNMTIAALYIPDKVAFPPEPDCFESPLCLPVILAAGTYVLKVVNNTKYALLDKSGKEVYRGKLRVEPTGGRPVPPWGFSIKPSPSTGGTIVVSGYIEAHIKCIYIIVEW
jgi:hypothetical protein